jgi:hypothetical protein
VNNLSSTAGVVAIAAGAVAIVALLASIGLLIALRRVRTAQRVVLGGREQDLVAHASELQTNFEALSTYVQDAAARLDQRMGGAEDRITGTIAYRSLVRYDAYGEMSGQQSTTIALLDATRSGIILSSIHHRDTARMYAKQIRAGKPEMELSPEEQQAIEMALQGGSPST